MRPLPPLVSFFAVAAFAAACGGPAFVPPPPETPPDEAIATFLDAGGLPAVAVAVLDGGETLYTKVAGVRRRGDTTPVTDDDAFHIGSNTKAMTALIAATLVDAGTLSWDVTAGDVLAGTIAVGAPYRAVTLAQLLSHTSGMPEISAQFELSINQSSEPVEVQRRQIAEASLALLPASAPGAAFLYSNVNYVVAGLMLEVATGMSWETLIAERIFVPLGMVHAGFGVPATPGTTDAPWGHDPSPIVWDSAPGFGPAGTVHASLGDLIGYVRVYLDGGLGPNGRIISEAALAEINTPRLEHYGFGWLRRTRRCRGGQDVAQRQQWDFLLDNCAISRAAQRDHHPDQQRPPRRVDTGPGSQRLPHGALRAAGAEPVGRLTRHLALRARCAG